MHKPTCSRKLRICAVKRCCYDECTSDSRDVNPEEIYFVRFPKPCRNYRKRLITTSANHVAQCWDCAKCELWVKRCGRVDFQSIDDVTKDSYICSLHFVGGKGPSYDYPDPVDGRKSIFNQVQLVCEPELFTDDIINSLPTMSESKDCKEEDVLNHCIEIKQEPISPPPEQEEEMNLSTPIMLNEIKTEDPNNDISDSQPNLTASIFVFYPDYSKLITDTSKDGISNTIIGGNTNIGIDSTSTSKVGNTDTSKDEIAPTTKDGNSNISEDDNPYTNIEGHTYISKVGNTYISKVGNTCTSKDGNTCTSKDGNTYTSTDGNTYISKVGNTCTSKGENTNTNKYGNTYKSKDGNTNTNEYGNTYTSKDGNTYISKVGNTCTSKDANTYTSKDGNTYISKDGNTFISKVENTCSSKDGYTNTNKYGNTYTSKDGDTYISKIGNTCTSNNVNMNINKFENSCTSKDGNAYISKVGNTYISKVGNTCTSNKVNTNTNKYENICTSKDGNGYISKVGNTYISKVGSTCTSKNGNMNTKNYEKTCISKDINAYTSKVGSTCTSKDGNTNEYGNINTSKDGNMNTSKNLSIYSSKDGNTYSSKEENTYTSKDGNTFLSEDGNIYTSKDANTYINKDANTHIKKDGNTYTNKDGYNVLRESIIVKNPMVAHVNVKKESPLRSQSVQTEYEKITKINKRIQVKLRRLSLLNIFENSIKANEKQCKFYTSLSYDQIIILHNLVHPPEDVMDIDQHKNETNKEMQKLTSLHQLILTLIRLRIRIMIDDLAYRFEISSTILSEIVKGWIDVLYNKFKSVSPLEFLFPSVVVFQEPSERNAKFQSLNKIRVIIDCIELQCQLPSTAEGQNSCCYCEPKLVYKALIGCTSRGGVCFVSDMYEGNMTCSEIFIKSRLADYLEPGDIVLADIKFAIRDIVESKQAFLNVPPNLKGKLSSHEELELKLIKKQHQYIKHVIARIKNFRFLHTAFPPHLRPFMSKVLYVCACLVNFQPPVVID